MSTGIMREKRLKVPLKGRVINYASPTEPVKGALEVGITNVRLANIQPKH